MACYDCEDCSLHIDKGGKCNKFEYCCPYDVIRYNELDNVKKINKIALNMQKELKEIEILDNYDLSYDLNNINRFIDNIIDKTSDETIKEYEFVANGSDNNV